MINSSYPLSIEQIFSQSFGIACRVVRALLPLYVALVCATAACSYLSQNGYILFAILVVLAMMFASCYISAAVVLTAHPLWHNREPESRQLILRKIDLLLILEIGWLGLRVLVTAIPLLLCLIIPGLIYLLNRSLSFYPLVTDRVTVSEALRESKQLMTAQPWYSINGPQMRISGLLFVSMLFAFGVAIASVIASTIIALSSHLILGGATDTWLSWLSNLAGIVVQQYLTVFQLVMINGFYLDLKNRYGKDSSPAPDAPVLR